MKAKYVILTPLLLAPEENVELCIRNYSNFGGLSISNANGQVYFPTGITTGLACISENNIPTHHLLFTHDLGMNFRCGTAYVLSLAAATGATIQTGLAVNGNCTITGQLTVNGVNVLNELNAAQSSTGPIAISDVSGLSEP